MLFSYFYSLVIYCELTQPIEPLCSTGVQPSESSPFIMRESPFLRTLIKSPSLDGSDRKLRASEFTVAVIILFRIICS